MIRARATLGPLTCVVFLGACPDSGERQDAGADDTTVTDVAVADVAGEAETGATETDGDAEVSAPEADGDAEVSATEADGDAAANEVEADGDAEVNEVEADGDAEVNEVEPDADGVTAQETAVEDTAPSCDVDCSGLPRVLTVACVEDACVPLTCEHGYAHCDDRADNGCETRTTTNADCGGCGTLCAPPSAIGECSTGECRIVACTRADYDDCDDLVANGCESSLRTPTDCAACDFPCQIEGAAASCATGSCQPTGCPVGLGNCDGAPGCEASLDSATHCGDCHVACAPPFAIASCATGACRIVSCLTGHEDRDGRVTNGCEVALP